MDRRSFLQLTGLSTAACAAWRVPLAAAEAALVRDPYGLLDLPEGFHYVVVQMAGEVMDDGHRVPARFDGMTCQLAADGSWVLLRNHEVSDRAWIDGCAKAGEPIPEGRVPRWRADEVVVDRTRFGGVSKVRLDADALRRSLKGRRSPFLLDSRMVLAGTDLNCAGGKVPGGWVSCEESLAPDHGWAFFVPTEAKGLGEHRRLDAWGRLRHEAVAIAEDGNVYLTEDDRHGLLYRVVPQDRAAPMGPGRLQAMKLPVAVTHQDGVELVKEGAVFPVEWVDIPDPAAQSTRCAEQGRSLGATEFWRGEGICTGAGKVWFAATQGGPVGAGQLWELDPVAKTLTLRVQVTDRRVLSMPDNLVRSPWGDVVICEDNYNSAGGADHQHLRFLHPDGRVHVFGRNPQSSAEGEGAPPGDEFAGVCFSPDGEVMFVNYQGDLDLTFAISGPWAAWRGQV